MDVEVMILDHSIFSFTFCFSQNKIKEFLNPCIAKKIGFLIFDEPTFNSSHNIVRGNGSSQASSKKGQKDCPTTNTVRYFLPSRIKILSVGKSC